MAGPNVALGKNVSADNNVPGETPQQAMDGNAANNSKWCATGAEPHWLNADLGGNYALVNLWSNTLRESFLVFGSVSDNC